MATYIYSASQISTQEPFNRTFFDNPVKCSQRYCRCIEADYKQFVSPISARRMGPLLKRAIATTVKALEQSEITNPDAIICGTGLGCIENTEKFLTAMIENEETCLQPTFFINSTHNTVASQIATHLKCNGYNNTFAHLGISFESALMDAVMMFDLGMISNAVVGAHDEMTPTYNKLFEKVKYWDAPLGECSVSFVIGKENKDGSLCRLLDTDICYSTDIAYVCKRLLSFLERNDMTVRDINIVVSGRNGDSRFDSSYNELLGQLFPDGVAECQYKHIFGESFTASSYGMLLGSEIIQQQKVPESFVFGKKHAAKYDTVLCINSFKSKDWSFILLSK